MEHSHPAPMPPTRHGHIGSRQTAARYATAKVTAKGKDNRRDGENRDDSDQRPKFRETVAIACDSATSCSAFIPLPRVIAMRRHGHSLPARSHADNYTFV
jgi:hypothetical protein